MAVTDQPSYYELLEIGPDASAQALRQAFRRLSKRYHPDTTDLPQPQAQEAFRQLQQAYLTLGDPARRRLYDAGLQAFQNGDFTTAESQLQAAISSGSLQPDLAEAALRLRARSRTALGKTAEAEADLAELKQGAAEMDQYWLAMAELELKKGNSTAAKEAVRQARGVNSRLQLPKELESLR